MLTGNESARKNNRYVPDSMKIQIWIVNCAENG